jgi:hypothetical protein
MPRLVTCHFCKVLQKLPDVHPKTPLVPAIMEWTSGERYIFREDDGMPKMVPAYDPVMDDFVERHTHGRDDNTVIGGMIQVYQVDQHTWDTVDIVTQIKKELHDQQDVWYEERDEYKEEALKCYNAHGNPDLDHGCPDYLDDSKRLGTPRYRVEGQTIEIPPKFRQYLCYLCPFQQTYIAVELRRRQGMYRDGAVGVRKRQRR